MGLGPRFHQGRRFIPTPPYTMHKKATLDRRLTLTLQFRATLALLQKAVYQPPLRPAQPDPAGPSMPG